MGGIPLGRIAGFPVNTNWSVLVILWLFTWSLASTLPTTAGGYSAGSYWTAGACGATVLLASLLAHELAHAIVARRAGIEVLGVTLWIFGGVTRDLTRLIDVYRLARPGVAFADGHQRGYKDGEARRIP